MADEDKVIFEASVEGVDATEEGFDRIQKAIQKVIKESEKAALVEQNAIRKLQTQKDKAEAATEKLIDSAVGSMLKESAVREKADKEQLMLDDKLIDKATDTQLKESRKAEIQDQKELQKRSTAYGNALFGVSKIAGNLVGTFKRLGYGLANSIRQMGAFRPEFLSMMFFGMALSRVFERNIQDVLELTGVTKTYAVTIRMMLLPVMMPLVKGFYALIIPIMKLPEPVRMAAGAFILLTFAIGKILFIAGTLALAFFGFLATLVNIIASFISLSVTVLSAVASLIAYTISIIAASIATFILSKAIDEAIIVTFLLKLALLALGFMLSTFLVPILLVLIAIVSLLLAPFILLAIAIIGVVVFALKLLAEWLLGDSDHAKNFSTKMNEALDKLKSGDWSGAITTMGEAFDELSLGMKETGTSADDLGQKEPSTTGITGWFNTLNGMLGTLGVSIDELRKKLFPPEEEIPTITLNPPPEEEKKGIIDSIASIFTGVKETIKTGIISMDKWIEELKKQDWKLFFTNLFEVLKGAVGFVLDAFVWILQELQKSRLLADMAELAGILINAFADFILSVDWMGLLSKLFTIFFDIGKSLAKMMFDAIFEFFTTVNWFKVGSAITTGIMSAVGSVLSIGAGAATGAGKGFLDSLTDLIGLQHGGIVTRPTLAVVGESGPEAVVPLGEGREGTVVNFSPNVYVTANVSSDMDVDMLADKITRRWNDDLRRLLIRK